MTDLFKEILPSILQTKKTVLDNESDYVPFVVNKALSFHQDCILYANQINMFPSIPKSVQYQYYINTIRPYKRPFKKWLKKEKIENIDAIKEYYGYSNEKAKMALSVLTDEQIMKIRKEIDKGGLNGRINKRICGSETERA